MTSFEEARQQLQKESSDGVSLYDHLSEVLLKILIEQPADASETFEQISSDVKAQRASATGPVDTVSAAAARAAQLKWATSAQTLFAVPDEVPEVNATVPDILDQANLWAAAGVSFGQMETYRIYLAIKKLAETVPASAESLRLWGRITCRSGQYIVVEGKASDEDLGELDENNIEGTIGGNRYTYWVSSGPGEKWTQLPPVTQAQIVGARKIRRYLTGNLDAAVPGYPPFPGTERNLLRAQIARITAGTSVSPAGLFEADTDSEPVSIKAAEAEAIDGAFPKAIEELMTPDGWVHHEFELNKLGRVRALPELEEGAPERTEEAPEEVPPLRSLSEDEPKSWGFRTAPAGAGSSPNSMVVAKSLLWPGAYAIACGKRSTTIYVGSLIKYSPVPYQIAAPPALQKEWAPITEESEETVPEPVLNEDGEPIEPVEDVVKLPPPGLLEQGDVLIDPTPPVAEEPAEED